MPELQAGSGFIDGSLSGLVAGAVRGEEYVEELLWGTLVGLKHASGEGWEVDLWVDFLEFKSHGCIDSQLPWGSSEKPLDGVNSRFIRSC